MATQGRTTQGASSRSAENRCYARAMTFVAGDQITEVLAWVMVGTSAHNMRAIIYDPSDGSRLAQGTETSVGVGTAQVSLPISYTVAGITALAVGVISENASGAGEVYYDAGAIVSYWDSDASTAYPPPATWTGIATDAGTDDVSIAATYTPAGGAINSRSVEDALAVSESVARSIFRNRGLTDSVTITEEGLIKEYAYQFDDAVDVADALSDFAIHHRVSADALALTELIADTVYKNRLLTDAASVADVLTGYAVRGRLIADALTALDQLSTGGAILNARTINDAVAVEEQLFAQSLHAREVGDAVTVNENLVKIMLNARQIFDTLSALETVTGLLVPNFVYNVSIQIGIDYSAQPIAGANRGDESILRVH